ncbi:MAG TPA: DUF1566 domain-containing protein [Gallionella sp.]|nr:DUF1566 domain-containing protein [Gallionella sp.]
MNNPRNSTIMPALYRTGNSTLNFRVLQMKKTISESMTSKDFASSCRRMALVLLCPLAIAGCDAPSALKPFVFDMTRLNQDGSVNDGKDYVKQPWTCVLDNQSGLIWEIKRSEPGLHNVNNTYSWYDPDQDTNGGYAGKANGGACTGSNCDTESYIKAVNAEKLCGLNDWYLPSRFELNTIVDTSVPPPGPTLPKEYFPETLAGKYWTDTTFKTRRASAWLWRFDQGGDYILEKSEAHNVRLTHVNPKKSGEQAKQPSSK